jgi:hypothetical protein
MKEGSKLQAFLLALQTSRSVQDRYAENPEAEMRRFDLSRSTIAAVRRGDRAKLWWILTRGSKVRTQVGHVIWVAKKRSKR